jgi:hypothetical protein
LVIILVLQSHFKKGQNIPSPWRSREAVMVVAESEEADQPVELEEVEAWAAGLEAVHARIAQRFGRRERASEPWPT